LAPVTTWDDFKGLPREERLKLIKQLLETGASIRQLEKLTGIGRGTIQLL
jgi:transposase